ncbi:MAG: DNA polymerase ligase N-terminal domain-containing protein [Actinomycetota bacterium]|nr:DNA ligase [Actinomycetota bacterium]
MKKSSLGTYVSKRDFRKTPEPRGRPLGRSGKPIYVIQKHDASHLHYDFRLEVDGVLKSWSVPKGPSTDPRVRRLAVMTEDHPMAYASFEGDIPKGEYGGGSVIVWDRGTFRNETVKDGKPVEAKTAVARGHVVFRLDGEKLHGGYSLTRMNERNWLLVKRKDAGADARRNPESSQPESVLTGRTVEEVAAGR